MRDLDAEDLEHLGGWAGRSAPEIGDERAGPTPDEVRSAMIAVIDRFRNRRLGGLHYLGPAEGGGARLRVSLDGREREIVARRSDSGWVLVASSSSGATPFEYAPPGSGAARDRLEQAGRNATAAVASRQFGSEAMLPGLLRGAQYGRGLEVKLALGAAGAPALFRLTKKF